MTLFLGILPGRSSGLADHPRDPPVHALTGRLHRSTSRAPRGCGQQWRSTGILGIPGQVVRLDQGRDSGLLGLADTGRSTRAILAGTGYRELGACVTTAVPLDFPDTAVSGRGQPAGPPSSPSSATRAVRGIPARRGVPAPGRRGRQAVPGHARAAGRQFGDPEDEQVIQAAAAIELTHLATLFHDDVMDEAAIRRGSESANSRWDNTVAILRRLPVRAGLPDPGRPGRGSDPDPDRDVHRLVSGQVAETIGPRPGEDPLDHYWRVVTKKTASLIATSGRFGAMFFSGPRTRW